MRNQNVIIGLDSFPNSPVAIWAICGGPGFKVHRKCFYIFGKLRSSTLRIRRVTSCHH